MFDSRAPKKLGNEVYDVGQVSNGLFATQAGGQVKDARQVLTADHGANQAVVTLRILDVLLILQASIYFKYRSDDLMPAAENQRIRLRDNWHAFTLSVFHLLLGCISAMFLQVTAPFLAYAMLA